MNGLAGKAILLAAHLAHEEVEHILVYAPAGAVGRLAVETVGSLALRRGQAARKVLGVHLRTHQLAEGNG